MEKFIKSTIDDCRLIELEKHHSDRQGNLTVVENGQTIPFDVKRVFFVYDVPGGEGRGSHTHKELSELIVAASGSFCVTLDDGNAKRTVMLNRPYQGLLVPPGLWISLCDYSSGAVSLVLASEKYIEEDYIRDYTEFLTLKQR